MTQTPDPLSNPTAPQRDLGNFTLKFFEDLFNQLQLKPDAGVSKIYTGKLPIVTTGAAVRLPARALQNGVIIKAAAGNANSIELGDYTVTNTHTSAGNGYELKPGEAISCSVSDLSALWINGTTLEFITWIGN